jgi:hypothetical protein
MPGNFRANLNSYENYIPDVCFSQVTAALKARLQLGSYTYVIQCLYLKHLYFMSQDGSKALACMVAAATSQGNLLIFYQRKLVKSCQIPFRDCCEILLYHGIQTGVTKEFLVAVSYTRGGVVIDLQQSSVS